MNNVEFSLNVGTVVPNRVRIETVPDVIVRDYPQFRGDSYFVVRDDIVIVDRDHKIVAMMPVGSSSAQANTRGSVGVASRGESANMSTEEIRHMQQILVQQGFDVTVDGKFGAKTRQALMEFQRKNGLQASGRMDNETMTKLGLNEQGGQAGERTTTGQGAQSQQGDHGNAAQGEHGNTAQGRQNEQGANPSSAAGQSHPQGQQENAEQGGNKPSTTGQGARQGQQKEQGNSSAIPGNQQNRQGNAPANNNRRERENGR
jgi:peptidoglycan hydrolase-like protein with peptidoglycan-binding domain